MKTLKDLQDYIRERNYSVMKRVIENIDPSDELNIARLFYLRGKIVAFEEINETLRDALKHHECQFLEHLNEGCVMCGATKE